MKMYDVPVFFVVRCLLQGFGAKASRSRDTLLDPELSLMAGSGSTLDKTGEFFIDILFVSSHIDKRLFKKQILINK